jgi:type I restriction enzyme R subunit
MPNEADTCRKLVVPKLQAAGWDTLPHAISEQAIITDGRIVPVGSGYRRKAPKRADYILRHRRDFPIAVVEAKADYISASVGLGQAKDYAQMLALPFAYSTNGHEIVEFDFLMGLQTTLTEFPTPDALWARLVASRQSLAPITEQLLTPMNVGGGKTPRYYQEIAINRSVEAILSGTPRILVTMATGTGKTYVAFQICWKLWAAKWNRKGEPNRRPKILYLADRNILVDDPKDKDFLPFGSATGGDPRFKIDGGKINHAREIYFAIYQALAGDASRPALYKEYPPDFFDLIIVDECHRGSARDNSSWRDILDHFTGAIKLGMTATPRSDDNVDTYDYFGDSIYSYTLAQGIDDGFLAPYCLHRIITTYDAAGWRPSKDELDRCGREIPDDLYGTPDFERLVALRARTEAIAKHITDFLKRTDRMAKTIVFCVDQEHALAMRDALNNLNADLVRKYPDYVCRVTAEEEDVGKGHLSRFQDPEMEAPVILTTSKLLTTGVDAPTCKNVILARVVNSMSEFKQIIGRGTRVREELGKLWFNILDYAGSAHQRFADPEFDGIPARQTQLEIDDEGNTTEETEEIGDPPPTTYPPGDPPGPISVINDPPGQTRRKFYVDGGTCEVMGEIVSVLDPDGKLLRTQKITDYTAEKVRTLYTSPDNLLARWSDLEARNEVLADVQSRGIDFETLRGVLKAPDSDPLDLLLHIAFQAPLQTKRQRADKLRKAHREFLESFQPEAREILNDILDKYAEGGPGQFTLPDVLELPPINRHGKLPEIVQIFGGADELRAAVDELQHRLYAA